VAAAAQHRGPGPERARRDRGDDRAGPRRPWRGAIGVTGARGPLRASTAHGDVTGTDLRSPDATFTTGAGDIDATFAGAPTRLDATTRAGDIDLTLPAGAPYLVQAETDTGNRTVHVPQAPDAIHHVIANTDAGDIDIH
jgi:DUF4097 and DUF4098 domain-containing protein YvlB